jgi:hypothetical protein
MATITNAQSVGINSDGSTPNASAMLDVSSTTKGFLAPRMSEAQRTAIDPAATGLLVYQTDGTSGFYYWNGSAWTIVGSGSGSGSVTSVATGTGLEGGPVTTTGTISLANTTVTAGSYTRASITVDAQGRITAAGDGAAVSLTGGVSGVLPIANGGTNASTAADARTNLGLGTAAIVNTGTASGNVPVLDGTGKIPTDLLSISGMSYKGNKDLSANPTVPVETSGNYYIVSVAGNETGSGLTFAAGDWMISNGTAWQKITNSSAVTSVAGKTGVVTLDGADITSGTVAIARGGTGASTASGALTNLGATTAGGNMITLANPSAVTFPRINADNTVSALDATAFRSAIGAGTGGGSVTSVSGTSPISVATGTTTPVISLSTVPVAKGGTGTTTGSITGTGALAFTAGGTNTNITLDPNGTGCVDIWGETGTLKMLQMNDASTTASSSSLYINKSGTITGTGYGVIANVFGATNNYGLSGTATGTGTYNYGVYGNSTGAATVNYGVYGNASGSTANYGVFGLTSGPTGTTSRAGVFLNQSTITSTKYGSYSSAAGVSSGTNIGGYFTATNTSGSAYALVTDAGNVGIGTLTPAYKLDVAGDVNITGAFRVNGTAIGAGSQWTTTGNNIYYATGNVGIGTSASPSEKLDIVDATTQGISLSISKTGAATNSSGMDITVNGSTGWNRGIVIKANGTSAAGNYGVYCTTSGASTGTNYGGYFTASGATANYALVTNAGNVGFGTLTPGYQLQVTAQLAGYAAYIQNTNGTETSHGLIIQAGSTTTIGANLVVFTKPGGTTLGAITQSNVGYVTYTSASDRRLKNNILNTHFGISDLMKIQVRDYVYKADASKTQVTGFIAQELYEVFPNAVSKPAKAEEMWSVDYGKVTPLLAKAIQDQQQTIETQKLSIEALQKANEAQQKQINELKKMVELLIKK